MSEPDTQTQSPQRGPPILEEEPRNSDVESPSLVSVRSEATTPRLGSRQDGHNLVSDQPTLNTKESSHKSSPVIHRRPCPKPKAPSQCPLLCCFFAEFDNKVGPMVAYESPRNFMSQEIQISFDKIHTILEETFSRFRNSSPLFELAGQDIVQAARGTTHSKRRRPSDLLPTNTGLLESVDSVAANLFNDIKSLNFRQTEDSMDVCDDSVAVPEGSLSIFDSCSEYIITGNELTGKIVNLSMHNIHILTRPTALASEHYERNALLFCTGFVLRRTVDPRPFRPVLTRLADTLRDMEVETQFLSKNKASNNKLRAILEWTLVSLNSANCECNLSLDKSNVLNLKLFRPPKPPALPVADYAVPIFLRRNYQVQTYEWDLAINWVTQHIDGVTSARKISQRAEVDLEMVQACLRVLRHHGVIALVDMFFYSNRYEATENAANLMMDNNSEILNHAVEYIIRRPLAPDASYSPSSSPVTGHSGFVRSMDPVFHNHEGLGSFRIGSVVSQANEFSSHSMPPNRRMEYNDVRAAIAELFIACHQGVTIGDLWVALISGDHPTKKLSSPLTWRKAMSFIDLRRFVTFGQVYGLLRRVHDFPCIIRKKNTAIASIDGSEGLPSTPTPRYDDDTRLQRRLIEVMTGGRCDDDLVCEFDRSFEELLAVLKNYEVAHVYSPIP